MKPWILILGGGILTLFLALWIYLFFAGDEAREDLFNALTFGDTSGESFGLEDIFLGGEDQNTAASLLRQLSLRRVIGYEPYAATASSSAIVYLAEAGTGHIYSVNPTSGEESRISNITMAAATQAVFSADKSFAIISAGDQQTLLVVTLPHGSSTLESFSIALNAFSFSLTSDNRLLYATQSGSAVTAYVYDLTTQTQTTLFTLPFREATIIWDTSSNGTHYVYPRTASGLEGYVYQAKNGILSRVPADGYGLSATGNSQYILYTKRVADSYQTSLLEIASKNSASLSFPFLPEKCALQVSGMLCGLSTQRYDSSSPDTWYSGEVSYSDELWYTDFEFKNSKLVVNLETESGRQLDITRPNIQSDDKAAFFVNKTDQSLWIYEGDFKSNSGDN